MPSNYSYHLIICSRTSNRSFTIFFLYPQNLRSARGGGHGALRRPRPRPLPAPPSPAPPSRREAAPPRGCEARARGRCLPPFWARAVRGGDAEGGQRGQRVSAGGRLRRLRVVYGPRLIHLGAGRAGGAGAPLCPRAAADAAQYSGQHRRLLQRRGRPRPQPGCRWSRGEAAGFRERRWAVALPSLSGSSSPSVIFRPSSLGSGLERAAKSGVCTEKGATASPHLRHRCLLFSPSKQWQSFFALP